MAFVHRSPEVSDRVDVVERGDGEVVFKRETSEKLDRLTEAEFEKRYVDESALRLQEG